MMPTGAPPRQAVFLDRDGVLTDLVTREDAGVSPRRLEDFRLARGSAEAVRRLRAAGLLVFVVTNQPDVARGHLAEKELARMHEVLWAKLRPDAIAFCPHDDAQACACRKPKPGMIFDLAARWRVDLAGSFFVGDSWKDVEAGRRAGCRTILVGSVAGGHAEADWVVATLDEAVRVIESAPGRS